MERLSRAKRSILANAYRKAHDSLAQTSQDSRLSAPPISKIEQILDFIKDPVIKGRAVGVCCGQEYGRTGTILACYLVSKGWTTDEAIRDVRLKRPGSIETLEQEETIRLFADSQ